MMQLATISSSVSSRGRVMVGGVFCRTRLVMRVMACASTRCCQAQHDGQRPQLAHRQGSDVLIKLDKAFHAVKVEVRRLNHDQFLCDGIDARIACQGARR